MGGGALDERLSQMINQMKAEEMFRCRMEEVQRKDSREVFLSENPQLKGLALGHKHILKEINWPKLVLDCFPMG